MILPQSVVYGLSRPGDLNNGNLHTLLEGIKYSPEEVSESKSKIEKYCAIIKGVEKEIDNER